MKSLNNENLSLNISAKIYMKNKLLLEAEEYLKIFKNQNCLIVIDDYIKNNKNKLNYIKKSFKFIKKKTLIFNDKFEPTFTNLKEIKKNINNKKKKEYGLIIVVGGGSTIDIGKGLSVIINYKGNIEKLQGANKFNFKTIPVITIPSIFGSGAEVTPSAVFINEKKKIKGGINSELVQPKICLIDPYFSLSNDYKQQIICSFDSLVHSIESFSSTIGNNFTKQMAMLGCYYVLQGIKILKKNDLEGLSKIAEGSLYSIISLLHSEQNITGASSYQLALYYGYKHAYCGASFLHKSIELTSSKNSKFLKELLLFLKNKKIINRPVASDLVKLLKKIKKTYKISDIKLNEKEIKFLVPKIKNMKMLDFSPFKYSKNDINYFLNNE